MYIKLILYMNMHLDQTCSPKQQVLQVVKGWLGVCEDSAVLAAVNTNIRQPKLGLPVKALIQCMTRVTAPSKAYRFNKYRHPSRKLSATSLSKYVEHSGSIFTSFGLGRQWGQRIGRHGVDDQKKALP